LEPSGAEIDYVKVRRTAHELVVRHGPQNAWPHATKLAERARDKGEADEQAFWEAVAASLKVR
jgi:hypothetical protein